MQTCSSGTSNLFRLIIMMLVDEYVCMQNLCYTVILDPGSTR